MLSLALNIQEHVVGVDLVFPGESRSGGHCFVVVELRLQH